MERIGTGAAPSDAGSAGAPATSVLTLVSAARGAAFLAAADRGVSKRFILLSAAGVFATSWAVFAVLAATISERALESGFERMTDLLTFSTAIVAVALGALCFAHRRMAGRAGDGRLLVVSLALAGLLPLLPGQGERSLLQLPLAAAWLALAAFALHYRRPGTDAALGIVALGLAQASIALFLAPDGTSVWVLASHLFHLAAVTLTLGFVAAEFTRGSSRQRHQLFDSVIAARADGERRQARQTIEAGRRHDLRSALFVLDGAARTLVEKGTELSDDDRRSLGRMLTTGVEQLGQLVDERIEGASNLGLDTLCRSIVHAEQRAGVLVTTAVPDGLRAVARPDDLAVVVRSLLRSLRNVQPLVVRGEAGPGTDPQTVTLFVAPAVVAGELADATWVPVEPAVGAAQGDDALDLYVATRLVAEQNGELWTARHANGLPSFALRLPV